MSKLTELLEGVEVEWKSLEEIAIFSNGKGHEKEIVTEGKYVVVNSKFVSTGGKVIKYSNNQICPLFIDDILIVMSDLPNGKALAKTFLVDQNDRYTLNQRIGGITIKNKTTLYPKFLNYYLNRSQQLRKYDNGIDQTNLQKQQILDVNIPILPIKVQKEIVRILDTFTELEAELAAELQKRRMQYKYYSTLLFDNVSKSDLHSIEEVCQVKKGATPIQKATPGEYPMVVTTSERKSCETYQFDAKAVCIPLVSSRGHGVASLNQVYYQEGKFALGNILCAIIPKNENKVCSKYLYYYFQRTKDYTLVPLMKGGANVALRTNDIEKIKVPIPSLEEQKRIVRILDKFDTLTTSMSEGLPKEIALRKKQYEYYRDRLLTFK